MSEKTLALIKAGALKAGHLSAIMDRYTATGLKIVGFRQFTFHPKQAAEFYIEHFGKDFFPKLIEEMCEGKTVGLIIEGEDAVARVRALNGPAGKKSVAGQLRFDFRVENGVVHGSDCIEAATREIAIVFSGAQ